MDDAMKIRLKNIWDKLKKFKYPALILLVGLLLVLIPGRKQAEKTEEIDQPQATEESEQAYCERMEAELGEILSKINGAGRVAVMLTLKTGAQTQYQTDFDTTTKQDDAEVSGTTQQKTVILSRGSAYDEAAVVKTAYPSFQGALIVSQGAGNATVRLELVNAVAALLGLGTDKISVVKMK